MMETPEAIAIKYFDELYKTLIEISVNADQELPQEYRTEEFTLALDKAYHLIQHIGIEVMDTDRANEEPPSIEL